jgi:hypothetical protein
MAGLSLEQILEEDHKALDAFVRGDPGPKKRLYSQKDDATLANSLGPVGFQNSAMSGSGTEEVVSSACPGWVTGLGL